MEYLICHASELEEKKPIAVDLDGLEAGVILSEGKLYAYENNCPHYGGPVCLGDVFARINLNLDDNKMAIDECLDEKELRLVCPWHAYEFDLRTGVCTVEPKLSLRKLHAFIKDDHIYIKG